MKKQRIPKEIQNVVSGILSSYGISLDELLQNKNIQKDKGIERKWITLAQAEKYTGVSRSTLGRWQKKGLLKKVSKLTPGAKSGKLLFLKSEIDSLLSDLTLSPEKKQ